MTQPEIIANIVNDIEIYGGRNVNNAWRLFKTIAERYGCKIVNTQGQPFNGSTYEIYRDVEIDNRHLKETIGHFRNVIQIFGDGQSLYVFNNNIEGGSNLNGNSDYLVKIDCYDR
mgnify:CR=1 FL=1